MFATGPRRVAPLNGCCRPHRPRRVNWSLVTLPVDQVLAQDGGSDHIENLLLLCGACNRAKGTGTQAELVAKLQERGQLAA